ncbi:MAG: glycosyltransferase [Microgenomates group bacterium]
MCNISALIFTTKENKKINQSIKNAEILTNIVIPVYPNSKIVETVREKGIKQAKTDWVLILDADERITPELAKEIKQKIKSENNQTGAYKIPRKNIFAQKKWLKFGGWWPDYQIRLINKNYFISWPKQIHSTPVIKGKIDYLKNPILHFFHGDIENMVNKTIIFEDIESDLLYQAKKTANIFTFFRKFIAELYRRLIKNFGFLDGTIGVIESIYQAFSKTITYLFLYEKTHKNRPL